MSWFDSTVDIDGDAAAVIVSGMKAVARADGDVHPRELEMIEALEAQLPPGTAGRRSLERADLRETFLRSLVLVALADGRISDVERTVIGRLAHDQGIADLQVDQGILEVKRFFLSQFSGVEVFRDEVREIATSLGLPPDEAGSLGGEAE